MISDPILTTLCRYADNLEDLNDLDERLSAQFGALWRRAPGDDAAEGRASYSVMERQVDALLSLALTTPAPDVIGVAAKLRLAIVTAAGGSDWSSPMIRDLISSAAADASRLAGWADLELDRRFANGG